MATFKPVGYAVMGLGRFTQRAILPGFRHSKKAKLMALVSGDRSKAKLVARKFGAGTTYGYDELAACLSNPQVEAVYIATNNASHAHYAIEAANAGRHVLCEKPMANSVDECRRMVEACRASDVRLMIAYRKYFDPATLELKRLITSGKLGRLKYIHSAFGFICRAWGKARAWRLETKLEGGGPLADVGVYCVNTIRWLVGTEPLEASAYAWTTDHETFSKVDENIAFRLNFPRGIVAQATASFGAAQSSFLQVHGEKGWAALNPAYQWDKERCLFGKLGDRWFEKKFKVVDELALELDALADSIRRQREPGPSGIQGMRDVAVARAGNPLCPPVRVARTRVAPLLGQERLDVPAKTPGERLAHVLHHDPGRGSLCSNLGRDRGASVVDRRHDAGGDGGDLGVARGPLDPCSALASHLPALDLLHDQLLPACRCAEGALRGEHDEPLGRGGRGASRQREPKRDKA